jgi:predicted site-specific integrase-resolvase
LGQPQLTPVELVGYEDNEAGSVLVFSQDVVHKFCKKFSTEIIIVNNETLSPNEELVQDIISILHVFSCRLYGLRKYKNQIKEDEEIAKELQDGNKSNRRTEN